MMSGEKENVTAIGNQFAREFALGVRLLGGFAQVTERLHRRLIHEETYAITHDVLVGILVRETQRLRSILEIAKLGYVENVEILCRSAFEGLLGLRFVVISPPDLSSVSPSLCAVLERLPQYPGRLANRDFRSELFSVFPVWNTMRITKRASELPAHSGVFDERQRAGMQSHIEDMKNVLGEDWFATVKRAKSYSGLKVIELAEYCELVHVYTSVYGLQSMKTHANMSNGYISENGTILFGPQLSQWRRSMHVVFSIFAQMLEDVNSVFTLRIDIADLISTLRLLNDEI